MVDASITYKIHPAIGFARVGDAPDSYYLEPAAIGALPTEPDDQAEGAPVHAFKEAGQIRRQAARFRIYRHEEGKPPVEVRPGAGIASVRWTVHIANKKSAWWNFAELQGDILLGPEDSDIRQSKYWEGPTLRNASVLDRASLITDPGPRTVSVPGDWVELDAFSAGEYPYVNFPDQGIAPYPIATLGRIRMTERGELLVLGGHGNTGGPPGKPLVSFAGGDGWFDDVGDGPVLAEIQLDGGTTLVLDAWVVSASPKFAP